MRRAAHRFSSPVRPRPHGCERYLLATAWAARKARPAPAPGLDSRIFGGRPLTTRPMPALGASPGRGPRLPSAPRRSPPTHRRRGGAPRKGPAGSGAPGPASRSSTVGSAIGTSNRLDQSVTPGPTERGRELGAVIRLFRHCCRDAARERMQAPRLLGLRSTCELCSRGRSSMDRPEPRYSPG